MEKGEEAPKTWVIKWEEIWSFPNLNDFGEKKNVKYIGLG